MNPDQTNTRQGNFPAITTVDLTGLRSRLLEINSVSGVLNVNLPNANGDHALYQAEEEGLAGTQVDVYPLVPGEQRRLVLKGTCVSGDLLVNADVAVTADKGKVRVLPVTTGTYRVIAIAEESGIDLQHVKARIAPIGLIVVP